MKVNWGTKIALTYSAFVLFIIGMVYLSFGEKFDLVTEDYYAQELQFQDKIDAKTRLDRLDEKLKTGIENGSLAIYFPHDSLAEIEGKIHCFRPSDESKDFVIEASPHQNKQLIPLERFSKGKYLIKIEWTSDQQEYYTEKTVIIP